MLIGYARVSTDDQNLDLQRDALHLAGCEKIYEDRISGAKAARPGLAMVLEVARAGAKFERNLVRERTQAGLNAARARGRKGGRPKVLEPAKRRLAVQLYAEKKHKIVEICRLMGISKPTLYNYVAEAAA